MDIYECIQKGRLNISARPNSSKTEIIGWDQNKRALKVNIRAPPEKGRANIEVIKFFSKLLNADVKIVKGLKSKNKILHIK